MKTTHFFSLALLSLLYACSGEGDALDAPRSAEPQPVTVAQVSVSDATAAVGEAPASRATVAEAPASRAAVAEAPASRAAVADNTYQLGVIRASVAPYTAVWNTPYSYSPSGWTSTTPIAVDHREATFYAYYPYHVARANYASLSSGYEFTLTAQPYSASEDICISAAAQKVTNNGAAKPTISFTDMEHVYSRIRLTLTRGTAHESTGAYAITNINFKNGTAAFASTAKQNIQSKVATALTYNGWDYNPNLTLPAGGTAPVIDLLVPPQPVTHGLSMIFTIDGHRRSVTIASSSFAGGKLVAGEQYSIALKLTDVAITMNGAVQIGDWANGATTSKDTPGYKDEEYVPYVILPSAGLRVAKGNLMRANGTGHWYLAPDQGCYTENVTGGDCFNWGLADPTNYGDNSTFGSNMNAVTAGCAAVLGAGWRVPTKADNEKLVGGAKKWGTYSSQGRMANGCYFGTNNQPSVVNQDDYAFLPAAGLRADGSMAFVGSSSDYWSSEPNGAYYAHTLYFDSESVTISYRARYQGSFVRCVTDL